MRSSLACKHAKPFGSTRPSSVASSVACKQLHHSNPHRWACRAEPSEQGQSAAGGGAALNEDMLAQLRKAQEEAARLKKELAELQENKGNKDIVESKPGRIDSTDNRELPWGSGKRTAWLSEADVDFFTGGGVSETADTQGPTAEAQATITKRLTIGGLITAGLAAFALVPTKDLRLKPRQPLHFYITQLLQAQAQLGQCSQYIEDADWSSLRIILPRIKGAPTNAEQALFDAVALLDSSTASKAEQIAGEFLEYLDAMDYNKYFDAIPTRVISGTENAEFVKFSSSALKAAQQRLAAFLALMPPADLAAAKQQVEAQNSM